MNDDSRVLRIIKNGYQSSHQTQVGKGNRVNIRLKPREMAFIRILSTRRRKSMAAIAREALKEIFRKEGFYGY